MTGETCEEHTAYEGRAFEELRKEEGKATPPPLRNCHML